MKIAVTADIHYGTRTGKEEIESFLSTLKKDGIEYLVIAGDLASRGADHRNFIEAIGILQQFSGKILFCPGNHDLWTIEGNSFELLTDKIPGLLCGSNIHLLDGNPFIIGDLGIVGSVGWYDYSFRVVPVELEKVFSQYIFRFDRGDTMLRWNQLTLSEYRGKECRVSLDGRQWKKSTWQDKRFIKWHFSDDRFLDFCIKRLKADIESILPRVSNIMVITHHLPFPEFVPNIPDPTWGFHRAYLGSKKIGETLLQYPQIRYVFFGHSHRNREIKLNGITARNVFFDPYKPVSVIDTEVNALTR